MTLPDIRLIDPDARTVLDTITRALENVNSYSPAARINSAKTAMKRLADRTAAEPEGIATLASTTFVGVHDIAGQVLVAWWTTAFNRRHVRVVGRLLDHIRSYLLNETKLTTRPPLWHVFPDRVYRRRVGEKNDLVTVCGCGACGSERALSWAGPCCGPCFDYTEEHGAPPPTRPAFLPTPSRCRAVAVSADGQWVAGATSEQVLVWNLDGGTNPKWKFASTGQADQTPQVTLSADGSFLAVFRVVFPGLRVYDLRQDMAQQSDHPATGAFSLHPSGRELVYIRDRSLFAADFPGCTNPTVLVSYVTESGPVVYSPDGNRVAVRNSDEIAIHNLDGADPPVSFPLPDVMRLSNPTRSANAGARRVQPGWFADRRGLRLRPRGPFHSDRRPPVLGREIAGRGDRCGVRPERALAVREPCGW